MSKPSSTYSRAVKARPSRGATSGRPASTRCPRAPPQRDPAPSCRVRAHRTGRLAKLRARHEDPFWRPGLGRGLAARPVPGTSCQACRRIRACNRVRPPSKSAARALRPPPKPPLPSFRTTRVGNGAPRASRRRPTCALQAARVPRALRRRGFSRCRPRQLRRRQIRRLCLRLLSMRLPQRSPHPAAPLPLQARPLRSKAARRGRPQRGAAVSVQRRPLRALARAPHAPLAAGRQRVSLPAESTYRNTCRQPFVRNGAAPTHALSWTWLMRSCAPTTPGSPRT
jgi:hypothetical protein